MSLGKRIGIVASVLVVCWFSGTVVIAIGIGPSCNSVDTVTAPLVCPGDRIVATWNFHPRGKPFGCGPCVKERWVCVNDATGDWHYAGYRTTFTAGAVYGLLLAIIAGLVGWRVVARRSARGSEPTP